LPPAHYSKRRCGDIVYYVSVCDILHQVPGSIQEQCTLVGWRTRPLRNWCLPPWSHRQIRIQIAASYWFAAWFLLAMRDFLSRWARAPAHSFGQLIIFTFICHPVQSFDMPNVCYYGLRNSENWFVWGQKSWWRDLLPWCTMRFISIAGFCYFRLQSSRKLMNTTFIVWYLFI